MTALQGFRVIELAEGVGGEYCGKLLSDFGAEVIKVERPGSGSPTRAMAPKVGDAVSIENSGLFAYLNTNKTSVALDLGAADDLDALHALVATADVVIDDHDAAWLKSVRLSPEEAERDHPSVLLCSITPCGLAAPQEWANAQALNIFHRSGWGYHTPGRPDPQRPPLKGPGRFLTDYEAALDAALCIVSSLYWRQESGKGQFIDVSALEVMVSRADTVIGRMLAGEDPASDERTAYTQGGPHGFFRCKDGSVYLYMTSRKHWQGFCTLMGDPEWARAFAPNWLEFAATEEAVAECRARFSEWVLPLNKDEVSARAQQLGVPLVAVNDASDLHRSPQYEHRGFFQSLMHPMLGEASYPTVPYKMSASPAGLNAPAPALGADGAALIGAKRSSDAPKASAARDKAVINTTRGGPLAGVRVLELTKVWAGPYAGKLLSFLGAEVIKVESNSNLDEMRAYGGVDINHAPYFLSLNPEIMSVQVNLKSEQGQALLHQMIEKSDIVINNLRPQALERMGLDYESMRAIKRDIISVSIKMFGNDGPLGYQTGYAPCFAALGGLNYLVGYEGEAPLGINMRYGDSSVGAQAAFAAIAALLHREHTGEGQFVDVSAVECMSSLVGDSLLEYSLTGKVPGPDGNVHADMAPHGCYPCKDMGWISIAVSSDAAWAGLCEVLKLGDLASDLRYGHLAGRQSQRKRLDERLSEATRTQDAKLLAERLRAAGVPAAKSQSSHDLISDEYLWERDLYRFVTDATEGARPVTTAPWHLSQTMATIKRGAPLLGEHNDYVYREILGLSAEKLEALVETGVVD